MADGRLSRLQNHSLLRAVLPPNGNGKGAHPHESKGAGLQIDFVSTGRVSRVQYIGGMATDVDKVDRSTAYAAAIYAYVAIRYIAENMAEAPLMLVRHEPGGDDEPVLDHPIYDILNDPSPSYDMAEVIELTQTYWEIDGDALWAKDVDFFGDVARVMPFPGCSYKVEQTAEYVAGLFKLQTSRGQKNLTADQVVYFRYPNPYDRQRGLSPVDVALQWMNLGVSTTATVRSWLAQALFPSMIIQTDKDWDPDDDEFKRFTDLLQQFNAGPKNAGKPLTLLGGGTATRAAFPLTDMVPAELLDRVEAATASVWRLPPIVLGHLVGLKNSPWSQMEQARRQAYDDCIIPKWRRFARALTRQLLRPIEPDTTLHLEFDLSQVRALREDESKKITDAAAAKHWTLDERRIYTGQKAIGGERGDFIEAIDGRPTLGGLGTGAAGDGQQLGLVVFGQQKRTVQHDPRDMRWARFDMGSKAAEPTWERRVYALLASDRASVLKAFDSSIVRDLLGTVIKAAAPQDAAERKATATKSEQIDRVIRRLVEAIDEIGWAKELDDLIGSTAKAAVSDVATELSVSFDFLSPALPPYVAKEAAWLVTHVSRTTRDAIAKALEDGIVNGEGVEEIRNRIEDSVGFSKDRAQLIARTETTRVTNGAQRDGVSELQASQGVMCEKSWLSARDAKVRPEHEDLDDGSYIPVDDAYPNGLQAPGEPNCRCTNLYRVVDEPKGAARAGHDIAVKAIDAMREIGTREAPAAAPITLNLTVEAPKVGTTKTVELTNVRGEKSTAVIRED